MNIRSILFPTDFSYYNDAALNYASSLAANSDATLHIVHVKDSRELNPGMGEATYLYAATWEQEYEEAKKQLRHVRPTSPGVQFEQHDLIGIPAEEIVSFAAKNKIDLIVMASHGRTGLSRLLMGSVAEAVMRRAHCPVLIVKQPAISANQIEYEPEAQPQLRMLK
jgi:nucleotide-binding universal stress UspA family protein